MPTRRVPPLVVGEGRNRAGAYVRARRTSRRLRLRSRASPRGARAPTRAAGRAAGRSRRAACPPRRPRRRPWCSGLPSYRQSTSSLRSRRSRGTRCGMLQRCASSSSERNSSASSASAASTAAASGSSVASSSPRTSRPMSARVSRGGAGRGCGPGGRGARARRTRGAPRGGAPAAAGASGRSGSCRPTRRPPAPAPRPATPWAWRDLRSNHSLTPSPGSVARLGGAPRGGAPPRLVAWGRRVLDALGRLSCSSRPARVSRRRRWRLRWRRRR